MWFPHYAGFAARDPELQWRNCSDALKETNLSWPDRNIISLTLSPLISQTSTITLQQQQHPSYNEERQPMSQTASNSARSPKSVKTGKSIKEGKRAISTETQTPKQLFHYKRDLTSMKLRHIQWRDLMAIAMNEFPKEFCGQDATSP